MGLAAAAIMVAPTAVSAQKFPDKTIEVIIHSGYGGGTDATARMMMIRSRSNLKTDMVVIAKRGGSGAAAHAYADSKPRDGHTMLALTQTHLYTIARGKSKLKIDDLVGVARAMDDPTFITVGPNSKFKTLADLIAASKTAPLNWGVAQIGGTEHIGLAQFAKAAGIKYKAVQFGGGAQMVQALMSGSIDATLPNVSEALTQVQDGSLRALVVMAEKRLKEFPNIPSSYELGLKVKLSTTRGYAVLKGTPQDRIDALSAALVKAMQHKVFVDYLKSAGLTAEESVAGHAVWDKQIKEEYAGAADALKELGLIK
jgi:putative tricarboxylic transport membrane protein